MVVGAGNRARLLRWIFSKMLQHGYKKLHGKQES